MERLEVRNIPLCDGPLIIEGAGGLMVPITRKNLQINLYKKWNLPVILCARTGLGTINHTMLSLEALWAREIPVLGIAFIGESNPDNIRTISEFAKVKVLGRLPRLEILNRMSLKQAFAENFQVGDFV
jgi:dethiobiotin synthetase